MSDMETFVKDTVASKPVVVWTRGWCPYCTKVKTLFKELSIDFLEIDLETRDNGNAVHEALKKITKQSSVPSVWINGKFVGGNDDTQRARKNGDLKKLLDNARISYSNL
jgi:glutaredoxin 3